MALIERNRKPTPRELRVFGLLVGPFFGLIGALILWRFDTWTAAVALWLAGLFSSLLYYCIPSAREPTYAAWMEVMYPIGWVISHILLALVYYGWVTPIGLLKRLSGRDQMRCRPNRPTESQWVRRRPISNVNRYFRQY